MSDKPLAAAAKRLQGKPGRPRKDRTKKRQRWSATALRAIVPRLMSLEQAALYLGVSPWTVRELAEKEDGILKRVRLPLPNNGELRKLLFDRDDLDRLIEAWKEQP